MPMKKPPLVFYTSEYVLLADYNYLLKDRYAKYFLPT